MKQTLALASALLLLMGCLHYKPTPQAAPTISAKPTYGSQELITVSFTGAAGKASDWIGLYLSGAKNTNYLDWLYTDGTQNKGMTGIISGSVTFPRGLDNGNYEARLFFTNSFVVQATVPFKVVPVITSVTMSKQTYYTNENIVVSFAGASGSKYDWIGLYPQGTSSDYSNRIDFLYTDGTRNGLPGGTAGTVTFTNRADRPKPPNNYDARLFFDGGMDVMAAAQFRTVPIVPAIATSKSSYAPAESIAVRFAGMPGNQHDWIGLVTNGAPASSYLDWLYTDGTQTGKAGIRDGEVVFGKGLPVAGSYEARIYLDDGNIPQASAPFLVPKVALTLVWSYPLLYQSTNNIFKVYHSTNSAAPWNVMATVPCTNNNQATLSTTLRVDPGPHYFTITTSNLWGESEFSEIVASPPLARGDITLKVNPTP